MAAPNSYNTTTLVSNVQLIGHFPLSNDTFTATEVINLANRELQTALISQILGVREGYYLTYVDYDTNQAGTFAIPSQAIGGGLAAVQIFLDPSLIPVNRIDQAEQFSTIAPMSTTYGYFIAGNTINVMPVPTFGKLRVWFFRRPNTLVEVTAAASISTVTDNVLVVSSLPSTFAVDTVVDLCADQPTFDVLGTRTITAISGTTVTLDSAVDNLAEFDWLCLQNQTPVPQIPVEFRPLLEQRVVVKVYELQGYLEKMKAAGDVLKGMEMMLFKMITPRNESQTRVINPQNGGFSNANTRNSSLYWSTR